MTLELLIKIVECFRAKQPLELNPRGSHRWVELNFEGMWNEEDIIKYAADSRIRIPQPETR